MTSFGFTTGGEGVSQEPPRVLALKKRVGFDAAVAAERGDEYVELDLKEFPIPDALKEWNLDREIGSPGATERTLRMRFSRGESRVTVRISVFAAGERALVAKRLIERADAVTSVELSDIRGPMDLGTLALVPASSTSQVVYWIFRNVFAEVAAYKTDQSAVETGCWIQLQLQNGLRAL